MFKKLSNFTWEKNLHLEHQSRNTVFSLVDHLSQEQNAQPGRLTTATGSVQAQFQHHYFYFEG